MGVNEYVIEYLVREHLAEPYRTAEADRLAARYAAARGARLATRAVAWLRRLRLGERQVPLTDAPAARWPRRAGTS